jgi:hypothetical protein
VPFPTCPETCVADVSCSFFHFVAVSKLNFFQESRVEMVNNVLSSMETLQINMVETPAGPTFFKVCNKTYVTDGNTVSESKNLMASIITNVFEIRERFLGVMKSAARLASSLLASKPTKSLNASLRS